MSVSRKEQRMKVAFGLYKKDELLFVARYWEDLQEFVEELKKLNKKWVDRREFSIRSGNEIIFSWNRK